MTVAKIRAGSIALSLLVTVLLLGAVSYWTIPAGAWLAQHPSSRFVMQGMLFLMLLLAAFRQIRRQRSEKSTVD
ncbi:MAG: hypothetical protein EOO77_32795 [Oxalobacteraceae bacterium]|nr:MAG: hypothetical protein EOO77_32795 [Oxalobacteraceae bacterium]